VLENVAHDQQLGTIANHILGPYAGIVANVAVSLACLTTAITLSVVFADFVRAEILGEKVPYPVALAGTLFIAFWFSKLGFSGIVALIAPILFILCPALITLSIFNLLYRFYGVKMIKVPVFGVFIATLVAIYMF
jgi:LIVCS family branched-chain amino acid:cation transporter